jgi:membrane-bound lytic murein transglycosylase B
MTKCGVAGRGRFGPPPAVGVNWRIGWQVGWRLSAATVTSIMVAACGSSPDLTTASIRQERAQERVQERAQERVSVASPYAAADDFSAYVEAIWPAARAKGVSRRTFDAAFAGVAPDPKVIELTGKQSEFVKPIWDYMASAVSDKRLDKGRAMATQWASTLAAIEQQYGVERAVVLGVWGMESNFGGNTGNNNVIRALSTLAFNHYRGDYFRNELITALRILEEGHVAPANMDGSWAGAMGQTQFMPSSFLRYAVDFDGDGRRDIWTSIPDALASTANYLKKNGWKQGLPWGFEVAAPDGAGLAGGRQSFKAWQAAGVRRLDGQSMPASGEASLFYPAGASGPVFLVTANFNVIKRYNNSNAYALAVAHLGERVYGGLPLKGRWPVADLPLSKEQAVEVQARLAALGYDIGEPDGKLGGRTSDAVRDYQIRNGLVPDGYPSATLLTRLRLASR